MDYSFLKLTLGVLATVGLYSVLYRENKFYRFWEHMFLGLASGYSVVALWTDTLKNSWWDQMLGSVHDAQGSGGSIAMGYPAYLLLLPIGFMGYFVFSKKYNWMSRIPIGILLGLYSGQQFNAFTNKYLPQVSASMKPLIPTTFELTKPVTANLDKAAVAHANSQIYISTAITNIIFTITLISVLTYFLFSFDVKTRVIQQTSLLGRWLLMIGFGAIFGSTVMMRFSLLIDRMYFIWIEWFMNRIVHH